VRTLEGSEARVPAAGDIGVDQKATAAEETPQDFADRRHRLHHLYTNSDRRDGFLHCPVLDLFDLFPH
jgi:predicted amidohydrolase YtcJ